MINFENTYTNLPHYFYQKARAKNLESPYLIEFNRSLAVEILGSDFQNISESKLAAYFSGQIHDESMASIAMAYSGHQFGYFSPKLGDGRALLLGEVTNMRGKRYDVQLKGSGRTPYSRNGDGLSSLGPVLREYITSESMFHLGVQTTRSLAVVSTGEHVYREQALPGGILTRTASSFIRVGTFEYLASHHDTDSIVKLSKYAAKRHFPKLDTEESEFYLNFLKAVAFNISNMVSDWMSFGFIHGVMNTDNISICGETLDYGPCAFMDNFKIDRVFSSIDKGARYAYNNQINIAKWNFTRLASCFLPLISDNEQEAQKRLRLSIESYLHIFDEQFREKMLSKLGIIKDYPESEALITALFKYLEEGEKDFTETFKSLEANINQSHSNQDDFTKLWLDTIKKMDISFAQATGIMKKKNPYYIARNHLVEEAIQAGYNDDLSLFKKINKVLENPYIFQAESNDLFKAPTSEQRITHTFCGT